MHCAFPRRDSGSSCHLGFLTNRSGPPRIVGHGPHMASKYSRQTPDFSLAELGVTGERHGDTPDLLHEVIAREVHGSGYSE